MAEDRKSSKFGLGLIVGAVAGTLAGILYAPKTGKQTRKEVGKKLDELKEKFSEMEIDKKVKDIYGTVSEAARDQYLSVTKELVQRLADLRDKVGEIDTKKYQKIVEEVLIDFKATGQHSATVINKMRKHLIADWQSLFEKNPPAGGPTKKTNPRKKTKK